MGRKAGYESWRRGTKLTPSPWTSNAKNAMFAAYSVPVAGPQPDFIRTRIGLGLSVYSDGHKGDCEDTGLSLSKQMQGTRSVEGGNCHLSTLSSLWKKFLY